MGMFDTIICKTPLPLTEELLSLNINWDTVNFQTKSLENCLLDYMITEDGKLTELSVEREYIPWTEEEKKKIKPSRWQIYKDIKEVSTNQIVLDYHGKVDFYAFESISKEEDIWVDFTAFFSYGKLDKIILVKIEKTKSRSQDNTKWMEERTRLENSFSYRLKKQIGWFLFWRGVSQICSNISQLFSSINTIIIRNVL